ncbi:hypothetical protein GCM10023346_25360 [Arthrobacter gyeryongensis]|uniref:Uncharacterized protein n=1 Tax=Arthrobacter gyeryongensis TaxID=1650592 RepID=A0ABP9SI42_9MICC
MPGRHAKLVFDPTIDPPLTASYDFRHIRCLTSDLDGSNDSHTSPGFPLSAVARCGSDRQKVKDDFPHDAFARPQ